MEGGIDWHSLAEKYNTPLYGNMTPSTYIITCLTLAYYDMEERLGLEPSYPRRRRGWT